MAKIIFLIFAIIYAALVLVSGGDTFTKGFVIFLLSLLVISFFRSENKEAKPAT